MDISLVRPMEEQLQFITTSNKWGSDDVVLRQIKDDAEKFLANIKLIKKLINVCEYVSV